ncbi:MFS transporter [Rhodococcoides trifolii]|uniref:MFS transporter n=1 Tax=Rhodococcoides trifolii TaxID=908250 RepID=A0A917D1X6_9NOCA|nr:DHA2 family efflux MFS transporter permease subunit [Rhodococcus trifolii]GGG04781.1 MFS transporter [Rhodococcus trifolii]
MSRSTDTAHPTEIPRSAWQALIVLLLGMFIALLDTTIVNVALPTIRVSLDASEATLSWIISGYALAFGLALITAGRVGDRVGHKWVFFTGLALFTAASLACGLATNDLSLVIARVVQGLAGGIFVPAVTAYIQLLFPPQARGKAFAIMGAVIGVSSALGPIIGGVIIELLGEESGWRGVFFVNLPIGILGLVLAAKFLPSKAETDRNTSSSPGDQGIDWIGLVLITAGLVALLVPLIEGQDLGWPTWTYATLAVGALLIAAFGAWEVFHSKRGHTPLVPPRLFTRPAFTGGTILALVYFAAFTSIFFTISILWQTGLGNSALQAGLVSLPFAVGSIVSSAQSNRLTLALGRNVLVLGAGLVTVGLGWLWLTLLFTDSSDLTLWKTLPPLLVAGLGNGCFIAPNAQFIVATVEREDAGSASGVISTMQRVGSAVGIAVIGSVLFGSLTVAGPGPKAVADGFTHAAAQAMGVSTAFASLAFLLVFALPRKVQSYGGPPAKAKQAA